MVCYVEIGIEIHNVALQFDIYLLFLMGLSSMYVTGVCIGRAPGFASCEPCLLADTFARLLIFIHSQPAMDLCDSKMCRRS